MAHLAQDETMLSAFRAGADIHRQTAARILGKSPEQVTSEERGNAKTINFGIIYGMGAQRLSREQKIPLGEAKSFIERYFLNFAGVYRYLEEQRQLARSKELYTPFLVGHALLISHGHSIRAKLRLSKMSPLTLLFREPQPTL